MKRVIYLVAIIVCALTFNGCAISSNLAQNQNVIQTNVVLKEANYHVVKHVDSCITSTYVLGMGGMSWSSLGYTATEALVREADLTGSQALVNVSVKYNVENVLFIWMRVSAIAYGTVIEFDK